MKKIALLLTFVYGFSFYIFGQTERDFGYSEIRGQITIEQYRGQSNDVVIPDTINNLPVVAIKAIAFIRTQITSITIGNNVTSIEVGALVSAELTTINVSANNPNYSSEGGVLYNNSPYAKLRF
jgi:hypothetical protein